MRMKIVFIMFLVCFVGFCAFLVIESGLFECTGLCQTGGVVSLAAEPPQEPEPQTPPSEQKTIEPVPSLGPPTAINAKKMNVQLGSLAEDSKFKFLLELTSTGAAIEKATLREFDNRDPDDPKPLVVLSPVEAAGKNIYSLANGSFAFVDQKQYFPLNRLNWKTGEVTTEADGSQKVAFEAVIRMDGAEAVKLTKTYRIMPDSSNLECDIVVENLSVFARKTQFNIQGPIGIGREGTRQDMRNIISAFVMPDEKIESTKKMTDKLRKAAKKNDTKGLTLRHKNAKAHFIWSAVTNKYFAAILHPVPDGEASWHEKIQLGQGQYYDPELMADKRSDGNENISFSLSTTSLALGEAGTANSSETFRFQLYVGPKDKGIFAKNPLYNKLAYFNTISFMGCCCPKAIINPLAFGIMSTMEVMYKGMGPLGNYGVVIIIFVFLVRLVLHPVTKKSQISMMKMQKLGPKIEELKKKYGNNKAELQKRTMALYKENGVSPVTSMIPMMIQMPIWIALYSAIYANIALRGAAFLPFWITDLSAPDALIPFEAITVPLLGWELTSFNLLPILLGGSMFLQQKMMPHSGNAQTNPQMAQQQKMMLVMMPIMMLVFLYKAPSGLNLYIMSSVSGGVIEQLVIRKHIRQKEEQESSNLVAVTSKTGGKVKKKKPKPFFKNTM